MIRNVISKESLYEVLRGLKTVHNGKEVIWVDMDGVVADFESAGEKIAKTNGMSFRDWADDKMYRHIENFYQELPLIEGAREAIMKLEESGKYDIYFLSAPSWGNVSCFSDKRIWIEKHFPEFEKRMDLSFHKGHQLGHYLIDDRTKYGAGEFIGEHIQYGNDTYPNWDSILKKLLEW